MAEPEGDGTEHIRDAGVRVWVVHGVVSLWCWSKAHLHRQTLADHVGQPLGVRDVLQNSILTLVCLEIFFSKSVLDFLRLKVYNIMGRSATDNNKKFNMVMSLTGL